MSVQIVPLSPAHLDDAAALVAARYRNLRAQAPELPESYGDAATILPLLQRMTAKAPGVAALHNGRLAGFLTAWMTPEHRGRPTVYSPEWANGAREDDSPRIYEAMYASMARHWVTEGFVDHFLTLFVHDRPSIEAWQWLGFGYAVMDGIRDLAPVTGAAPGVDIRRAALSDLTTVLPLWLALNDHLVAAPVFLVDCLNADPSEFHEWLADERNALWVAYRHEQPVASLGIGPSSDNACTIIRDPGTASIRSAYTLPAARGGGLASAMLDRAIAWARGEGYLRCSVDFETMNTQAARFWPRHFRPVCLSLGRHINERIRQAG